jgi:Phage-related lysozyme (muraminidase)
MQVPSNTIALAKYFEGFFPTVYLCPANFYTIGFGHLCKKDHPPITREEGEIYLNADLQDALKGTIRICPILITVDEKWLGAIVDFVFNLGSGRLQQSTLRRKINAGIWTMSPRS